MRAIYKIISYNFRKVETSPTIVFCPQEWENSESLTSFRSDSDACWFVIYKRVLETIDQQEVLLVTCKILDKSHAWLCFPVYMM